MDLAELVDIFLNLDKHLEQVTAQYGPWVYALLFAIVFTETGIVVMPFLPGDSLLFVTGALAGIGALSLPTVMAVLISAAIIGDNVNYWVGRNVGDRVFSWQKTRLFNREAFDRTHAYYEKYGGMTIIIGRYMPFVRTFVPFVAGVGRMTYPKFLFFSVLAAFIWVISLTTLGYLVGNTPWVKANFSWVTLAMIVIPGLPAVYEVLRQILRRRAARRQGA
jgi:membrane-associated protein